MYKRTRKHKYEFLIYFIPDRYTYFNVALKNLETIEKGDFFIILDNEQDFIYSILGKKHIQQYMCIYSFRHKKKGIVIKELLDYSRELK